MHKPFQHAYVREKRKHKPTNSKSHVVYQKMHPNRVPMPQKPERKILPGGKTAKTKVSYLKRAMRFKAGKMCPAMPMHNVVNIQWNSSWSSAYCLRSPCGKVGHHQIPWTIGNVPSPLFTWNTCSINQTCCFSYKCNLSSPHELYAECNSYLYTTRMQHMQKTSRQ